MEGTKWGSPADLQALDDEVAKLEDDESDHDRRS